MQKGYEANGYAPNPFCTVCKGAGLLYPRKEDGSVDYSKMVMCKAPSCLDESFKAYKRGDKAILAKGLPSLNHNFTNFKRMPNTEEALKGFSDLAFGNTDKPWLFCYGGVGNGKTHLAEATVIELNRRGVETWYFTVAGMMSKLRSGMDDNSLEKLTTWFSNVEGLILDDWGVEYGSDWELSRMEAVMDERYRNHLITVVITNLPINKLEAKSLRITSRLMDSTISTIVFNKGSDYRRI
jgi:DNA replication protein DnaC